MLIGRWVGDCTNSSTREENWKTYYCCNQDGIHYHCTQYPEIELERTSEGYGRIVYSCPKCGNIIEIDNPHELKSKCLRMLNIPEFKNAKLIWLDDWYVPEIKEKKKRNLVTGYILTLKLIKMVIQLLLCTWDIRIVMKKCSIL